MATKQEISESINAGIQRVESTFGPLSDDQLAQKVHESAGGWTAKQILAHLAGRGPAYDTIIALAGGGPSPFTAGMNVDDWNQQIVDELVVKSRDDLLAEFRSVHQDLVARVQDMDEDLLGKTIDMPRGAMALGDILAGSGGRHSINHAAEVEQALGLSTPDA